MRCSVFLGTLSIGPTLKMRIRVLPLGPFTWLKTIQCKRSAWHYSCPVCIPTCHSSYPQPQHKKYRWDKAKEGNSAQLTAAAISTTSSILPHLQHLEIIPFSYLPAFSVNARTNRARTLPSFAQERSPQEKVQ